MSKKYRPIIKEGTHLASSKETIGAMRGTLLDDITNKVVGQAEWEEIDDDDDDNDNDEYDYDADEDYSVAGALLGTAAVFGIAELIGSAASKLEDSEEERQKKQVQVEKQQIKEQIRLDEYRQKQILKSQKKMARQKIRQEKREKRNAKIKKYLKLGIIYLFKGIWIAIKHIVLAIIWIIKKTFIYIGKFFAWAYKKIRKKIKENKAKKESLKQNLEVETYDNAKSNLILSPKKFDVLVDEAVENFQNNMTSEEAQIHLLKILLLSNELAKEIRELSSKNIVYTEESNFEYIDLQNTMEKLTTEKVTGYINYILENNRGKLEPSIANSLLMNFYAEKNDNQELIEIKQEKIQEALRLQ